MNFIMRADRLAPALLLAVNAPGTRQRLGFLAGEIHVPDDFDRMEERAIEALFGTQA